MSNYYDMIIVGAGLSGLMCAYELRNLRCLLLEKEDRLGGRVLTREYQDISYDLGAVINYDNDILPFTIAQHNLIKENAPMGVFYKNTLAHGKDLLDCLTQLASTHAIDLKAIDDFQSTLDIHSLSSENFCILNSALKTKHPGNLHDYSAKIIADIFKRYYPHHYSGGNTTLVEAISKRLQCDIALNTEVIKILPVNNDFNVICTANHSHPCYSTKRVILATPATTALSLIRRIQSAYAESLQQVKYGSYFVVALFFSQQLFDNVSYVVTPDFDFNFIFQRNGNTNIHPLLFYFTEDASHRYASLPKQNIIEYCLNCLKKMLPHLSDCEVLFADTKFWEVGGTIINSNYSDNFNNLQLLPNLFISGDYTHEAFPYGMHAAIAAGRNTAAAVQQTIALPSE